MKVFNNIIGGKKNPLTNLGELIITTQTPQSFNSLIFTLPEEIKNENDIQFSFIYQIGENSIELTCNLKYIATYDTGEIFYIGTLNGVSPIYAVIDGTGMLLTGYSFLNVE